MKTFLQTHTINPTRATLQRELLSLDADVQELIESHWETFMQKFQLSCQMNAGRGLYTTAIRAAIFASNDLWRTEQNPALCEKINQWIEALCDKMNDMQALDTKVECYWYNFAEQYRAHMPHCNNRIMEDFQAEVAKVAHKQYQQNPDCDIRLIGLDAVQAATVAMARSHPEHHALCADMTNVSRIAHEQKWAMLQDVIHEEPKKIIEPECGFFAMFMETNGVNPLNGELRRALLSLNPLQLEIIARDWDSFKTSYDMHVQEIHTEYDWTGPYQIALYALRATVANETTVAHIALDEYVAQNMARAASLDRRMSEIVANKAQLCFDEGQSVLNNTMLVHEYMDEVNQAYTKIAFRNPNQPFMVNTYDAISVAADVICRMYNDVPEVVKAMQGVQVRAAALKNEVLCAEASEFAEQSEVDEWEEII